ncbi:DUF4236 domain-containing protein [Aquamicrobium sp. LC103]|uniref:DUF4236 domain-containing protein n=1 Tax=Aquamicrobium sp. LC103 TaxID=1120658 RepID=UPI000AAAF956|nr:DUF4236 domain-containing protein [Aquamicrobium sp. LC103]
MAFKFRRTLKIAPGVRLNVTHRGASARIGPKGLGYTVNANGRKHVSAGIPGSGIHVSEQIAPPRRRASEKITASPAPPTTSARIMLSLAAALFLLTIAVIAIGAMA